MKIRWYKGTRVGRGSELARALDEKDEKRAAQVHERSMAEFRRAYPMCDDAWFARMNGVEAIDRRYPNLKKGKQ